MKSIGVYPLVATAFGSRYFPADGSVYQASPELRGAPGCASTAEVDTTWCPWDGAEARGSGRDLGTCWGFTVWASGQPRQRLVPRVTCPAVCTWPLEGKAYSQT